MSVLIKEMEMPKGCYDCNCFIRDSDGSDYCCLTMQDIEDNNKRDEDCPLVPVPKHGRLIDEDELFKEMERKGWFDNADRDIAEDLVLAAPTIIPTEEGET